MKSILRATLFIACGLLVNAVVGGTVTGCSAELAKFKADPGGTILTTASKCAPAALKFGGDVTSAVDQGGGDWFTDFQAALDVLNGYECVETQLRSPSPSVPSGLQQRTMAEASLTRPSPGEAAAAMTPVERRKIALREIQWRKHKAFLGMARKSL